MFFKRKATHPSQTPCFILSPSISSAGIPCNGNDYLLAVREQANATTLKSIISPPSHKDIVDGKIDQSHPVIEQGPIMDEWTRTVISDFKIIKSIPYEPLIQKDVRLASVDNNNVQYTTKRPTMEILKSISHNTALELIQEMMESEIDCLWVYALLGRLDGILAGCDVDLLRRVVRGVSPMNENEHAGSNSNNGDIGNAMEGMDDATTSEKRNIEAMIIVVIVCYCFGQLDLLHHKHQ